MSTTDRENRACYVRPQTRLKLQRLGQLDRRKVCDVIDLLVDQELSGRGIDPDRLSAPDNGQRRKPSRRPRQLPQG